MQTNKRASKQPNKHKSWDLQFAMSPVCLVLCNGYCHCLGPKKKATLQMADIKSVVPLSVSFFLSVFVCLSVFLFVSWMVKQIKQSWTNHKRDVKYVSEIPESHKSNMFRYTAFTESFESLRNQDQQFQKPINLICFATPDLQNHMNRWGTNTNISKISWTWMVKALGFKEVAKHNGAGVYGVQFSS